MAEPPAKRRKVEEDEPSARELGLADERKVGMNCFLYDEDFWFSGVLKHFAEDFIVNEVDQEQQVVHLTSQTPLTVEQANPDDIAADGASAKTVLEVLIGSDQVEKLWSVSSSLRFCESKAM
jgi:hypothetical protein